MYITITMLVLTAALSSAKEPISLDTIYANDQKNVALFFPKPIRQAITGANNFVFTYNREKAQYFGLLQAEPGKESNLLVITEDGSVFSYIVKYRVHLTELNFFMPQSNSIGNERPVVKGLTSVKKTPGLFEPSDPVLARREHYRQQCSELLDSHQKIGRIKKGEKRIVMSVENIVFQGEALYFVIKIENRSTLDYDINFLNFMIWTRKKGKKKSMQNLYQDPLLRYHMPSKVEAGTSERFVYVMPKFSIDSDRRAVLKLNEKSGERDLELKISHRKINNPN